MTLLTLAVMGLLACATAGRAWAATTPASPIERIYADYEAAFTTFVTTLRTHGDASAGARESAKALAASADQAAARVRALPVGSSAEATVRDILARGFDANGQAARAYAAGDVTAAQFQQRVITSGRIVRDSLTAAGVDITEPAGSSPTQADDGWSLPYPLTTWWFWVMGPAEVLIGLVILPLVLLMGGGGAVWEWLRDRRRG